MELLSFQMFSVVNIEVGRFIMSMYIEEATKVQPVPWNDYEKRVAFNTTATNHRSCEPSFAPICVTYLTFS